MKRHQRGHSDMGAIGVLIAVVLTVISVFTGMVGWLAANLWVGVGLAIYVPGALWGWWSATQRGGSRVLCALVWPIRLAVLLIGRWTR